MAKNSKAKYIWVPLIGLVLTVLTILAPWLYGAGKAQAGLVAADKALVTADETLAGDLDELEEQGCEPARGHTTEIAVLKDKFETYHLEQKAANTEILSRLPK